MSHLVDYADALWGFVGALVYSSGALAACLYARETKAEGNERSLCFARFAVRVLFGTSAAAAFTVTAQHFFGWAELHAVAFIIGGTINPVWDKFKDVILDRLAAVASAIFNGKGASS